MQKRKATETIYSVEEFINKLEIKGMFCDIVCIDKYDIESQEDKTIGVKVLTYDLED